MHGLERTRSFWCDGTVLSPDLPGDWYLDSTSVMTDKSPANGQPYEIVSIQRAEPPPGGKGSNWHRYVIAYEGTNTIHGCRQGSLKGVTSAVEEMVAQMNERHLTRSTKTNRVDIALKKKTQVTNGR